MAFDGWSCLKTSKVTEYCADYEEETSAKSTINYYYIIMFLKLHILNFMICIIEVVSKHFQISIYNANFRHTIY